MTILVQSAKNLILSEHANARLADCGPNHVRYEVGPRQFAWHGKGAPCYHYLDQGVYREIDTAADDSDLVGFADKFSRCKYIVHVDGQGARRIYPRRENLSEWVSIGQPECYEGTDYKAMVLGTQAKEPDNIRWDDGHVISNIINTGCQVQFKFVLKDKAAGDRLTRIRFPLNLNGLQLKDNIITDGKNRLAIVAPGWLSDARRKHRVFPITYHDGYLYIELDLADLEYPILVDPSLDLEEGASGDDGFVSVGEAEFNNNANYTLVYSSGYGAWCRFSGVSGLGGATVTSSYLRVRAYDVSWSDGPPSYFAVYANDATAPTAPTSVATYSAKVLTTASGTFSISAWSGGTWYNSGSLNDVMNELTADYDPSAIMCMCRDGFDSDALYFYTYDSGANNAPELHLVYESGGEPPPASPYRSRRLALLGVG